MKIIENKIIPVKGFSAMYFCGILFVRKGAYISKFTINHENIHHEQAKELLFVFFYLLYVLEWFVRLFMKGNAYSNVSFEREAYQHMYDLNYIKKRKRYSFFKYYRK